MSLRSTVTPRIAQILTSTSLLNLRRTRAEVRRKCSGQPHTIHYFHQVGDPYSCLASQLLPVLAERYDAVVQPFLVTCPPDWAAPEREHLVAHSRRDAGQIATPYGLTFRDPGQQPSDASVAEAQCILTAAIQTGCFIKVAADVESALWNGDSAALQSLASKCGAASPHAAEQAALDGAKKRDRLGHYLGATFHYAGEWYWGPDRLYHLESRLHAVGAGRGSNPLPALVPPVSLRFQQVERTPSTTPARAPKLEFFLSLRSPYSYLAVDRTLKLADHYGLELDLRMVLPMVMRGLPVPQMKRTYIMLDCAREARTLGIPFGRISDPLGKPVERGLSILPSAVEQGRGTEYVRSFLRGVWSQGWNAGNDGGLRAIVERAGLDWTQAREQLTSDAWRAEAESNREAMFAQHLWGVPSFRYGKTVAWGQDRLWLIEQAILECRGARGTSPGDHGAA